MRLLCLNFKEFISSKRRDEKVGIFFPSEAIVNVKHSKSAVAGPARRRNRERPSAWTPGSSSLPISDKVSVQISFWSS